MTEPELDLIRRNGSLLREIVSQQVTLKKVGRELKGCCPFHADPDPSFTVYDDGHFYCYGCGAHGNSIDYVMKRDGIGFPQAVKLLQPEVGLTPAQPKKPNGSGVNGVGHAEMWEPIVPPPGDAPPPTEDQLRCDLPNPYTYRDAAGRPLCYVRRFEAKPGKSKLFWPLTFGLLDGKCGWHAKAPATPRPLYGLDRLSQAEPDATVLLCEGEKAADAAQRLFPDFVAMTWMGGANADGGADLSPIEGLSVILWPDADKVGREVMARIAKRLPQATITLNTDGLSDGFDAADLEQEGCADADAWLDARLHEPESPPPEPAPDQEENLPGTEPEPAAKPPELFGPPTLADLITDLAAMDEISFARIAKATAIRLGVTATALTDRVQPIRSAAKARARAEEREAAKRKAKAEEQAKQLPPLTAPEFEAEIERLAKLPDAEFYAVRPAAALRLRCTSAELTTLVHRAKAEYARRNATDPPFVTEQDVMRAFVTQYSDRLRFNHSSAYWLVWAEHFWQPDQRKLAFYWSLDLCRQMAPSGDDGRAVVEKVRFSDAVEKGARTMPTVATEQGDWDNDPWLLGTPGGVVDLKTATLRPGDRRDMITMTTAVTPADTPDCPIWLKFLNDALVGDVKMIGFLQRYLGYCLTGLTREEVFLFLFGVGGTGKGTVVKTVTSIMGDYTITAPMELFTAQGFRPSEYYRATMAGKRLLVAAETEQTGYWAEAFIKEITGGDKLSARHPAGKPFNFDPTHKPLLHGNHMPKMRGRSTAMERRLRIALFNNKPETPDTELKEKLRAEWPAILRWMIDGCLSWQMNGLQPPDAVTKANQSYFETQDILGRWIEDCCILDPNLQEEPAKLRASFNRWSRDNDLEEMSANAFADILNLFEDAPLKRIKDHDGKRWIRGIGLQVTPEQQSQQQRRQGERDDD